MKKLFISDTNLRRIVPQAPKTNITTW